MSNIAIVIFGTAILSSLLTLTVVALTTKYLLLPKLRTYIEQELLPAAQDRVRDGALEAGEELLPTVRTKVKQGITDALVDAATGSVIEKAAGNVAGNIEASFNNFFGKKR
ncbi:MAG: hypothetical protein ACSHWQ_00610 [Spongiibacteraceae bacterium]